MLPIESLVIDSGQQGRELRSHHVKESKSQKPDPRRASEQMPEDRRDPAHPGFALVTAEQP